MAARDAENAPEIGRWEEVAEIDTHLHSSSIIPAHPQTALERI